MDKQSKVQRMAESLSIAGIEGCIRGCEERIAAIGRLDVEAVRFPNCDGTLAAHEARAQGRLLNVALLERARAALVIRVRAGGF